eukprot:scaffold19508_cov56-Isochrysis_galbana.AAC.1
MGVRLKERVGDRSRATSSARLRERLMDRVSYLARPSPARALHWPRRSEIATPTPTPPRYRS